jgi:zona occludens toxin (predicted ATPase)
MYTKSKSALYERGSVLLVTMVFLLLFAIVAASIFRGSQTSVQAVANMQWRNDAINAANVTANNILSSTVFITNPGALTAQIDTYDFNADGTNDVQVTIGAPVCHRVVKVDPASLNVNVPQDAACLNSENVLGGTFCADTEWSIALQATDTQSAASVQIEQGIAVRVLDSSVCN